MPEQYFDLYSTTVAIGGYTAGSGVLNVAATSPVTLGASDTTRFLVYRVIAGVLTPIVLLKATAVNSSTQFAVAAEGSDANALVADVVINVNTVGAMNQFRIDACQTGTFASLPATTGQKQGNRYKCTDVQYEFIFNGSAWAPFYIGQQVTLPIPGNFSWQSQGSATLDTSLGTMRLTRASEAAFNVHAQVMSAPATPYHVIFGYRCAGNGVASNIAAGICVSDGTKYQLYMLPFTTPGGSGANQAVGFYLTNNTTLSATPMNIGPAFLPESWPPLMYVRIGDDGTNKTIDVGPAPAGPWTNLLSQASATNLSVSKLGPYVNGGFCTIEVFHVAVTA